MMKPDPAPGETDVRDAGPSGAGARRAVVGLSVVLAVVAGIVVLSARQAPRAVDAAVTPSRPSAGGVQAALDAAARYQADGKYGEAAAILSKVVDSDPTDRQARIGLARALMGQRQHAAAYAQYEAAISLLPRGTMEKIALEGDAAVAELHFEAGTCANMAGRPDRAEEHYSMAQTADAREPRYPLYLAMVQLKRGGREGETAAIASLLRATHLNPELGEAWGTLAEISLRQDQPSIAAQHIEKARRLQPDVVRWRVVEARMLNRRGEADRAAALLTALPEPQRREPHVLGVLAESFGLMKQPLEAARAYASAFAASAPPNPELAYQGALWFQRAGDLKSAADLAGAAASLGHADARDLRERFAQP